MSKIGSKDTKIEILFRKALWKKGFRYRKNSSKHFGKPDIVLPKYKTVIFIDSCFWHSCPKHGYLPKSNLGYWRKKFERNKERDCEVKKYYKKIDWKLFRVWEHNIKKDPSKPLNAILKKIVGKTIKNNRFESKN